MLDWKTGFKGFPGNKNWLQFSNKQTGQCEDNQMVIIGNCPNCHGMIFKQAFIALTSQVLKRGQMSKC